MNANSTWYLGLDFGTTHLRGVLLDRRASRQYPLCWLAAPDSPSPVGCPTVAYLSLSATTEEPLSPTRFVLGTEALALDRQLAAAAGENQHEPKGLLLDDFKPYLNLAIPYYGQLQHRWEPTLQVYGQLPVSLYWLQLALATLLAQLKPADSSFRVGAVGLSAEQLAEALASLEGIAISSPAGWSDAYRFNLREAILEVGLVERSGQIFFVEESIAVVLGLCDWEEGKGPRQGSPVLLSPPGTTLAIHSGASTTELLTVELPDNFKALRAADFGLRNFAYGGNAFVQDIFYQLLYPQWLPEQAFLAELAMEFPQPGMPDPGKRELAYCQLRDFPGGRRLLETAKRVWSILQHQDSLSAQLGTQQWSVKRSALVEQVVNPFLQHLNHELNALLSQRGIAPSAIAQVVCSGGMALALFPFLKQGLQPKLTEARWVRASDPEETTLAALGASRLPFFPQVLDAIAHQYSDYFLLQELLQVFPQRGANLDEIWQALERRGVNVRTCDRRLLNFLQGELPQSLIPTTTNTCCLSVSSQHNRDYQGITAAPLFEQENLYHYRLNHKQSQRLQQYLAALVSGTRQQFTEPLDLTLSTFTET